MKKYISLVVILFAMSFIFIACSDDSDSSNEDSGEENETTTEEKEEDTDDTNSDNPDNDESNADGPDGPQEITEEDQEDLEIGDTGKVSTTIGDFEITVKDVTLMSKLDGEESELDKLLLLDINLKNTSEWPFEMKDMLYSTEVKEDLEGSGWHNGAEFFESVDELEGDLAPGEDMDGQFITDVYDSDVYYFMQGQPEVDVGTTNQAMWKIPLDEIEEE